MQPIVGMWISGRLREPEEAASAAADQQDDATSDTSANIPSMGATSSATRPDHSGGSMIQSVGAARGGFGGLDHSGGGGSPAASAGLFGMQAAAASKAGLTSSSLTKSTPGLGGGVKGKVVSEEDKKQKREAKAAAVRERALQPPVDRRAQIIMDMDDDL